MANQLEHHVTNHVTSPLPFVVKNHNPFHRHGHNSIYNPSHNNPNTKPNRKQVTAYLEPPFPPNMTVSQSLPLRLPLRTQSPQQLIRVTYSGIQSCRDVPAKFPVDRGVQFDVSGEPIVTNVGDQLTPPDSEFFQQQTPYCPVDQDPFLPWIHDIFVLDRHVQFVAQNKRRCQTGSKHRTDEERLEPQVALLQSVSVQRLSSSQAVQLAPELWHDSHHDTPSSTNMTGTTTRYRLAPYDQADDDAKYTRFICRFHSYTPAGKRQEDGETLSKYPFSYELTAFRKHNNKGGLISKDDNDNAKFWTSTLLFSCPLPSKWPDDTTWTTPDDIPLFHVDLIPIRTPARFPLSFKDGGYYLSEEQIGPEWTKRALFDPLQAWGENHILPLPEASGRWENLPLCPVRTPPIDQSDNINNINNIHNPSMSNITTKPHLLSACLWAAASFRTRGKDNAKHSIDDTLTRLQEWIEFHLLVGFDHIYIYDNSGAFGNSTSLKPVVDLFPSSKVTWIDWPMQVCNNNIPAHDNKGERSSQYAAENSCRTRYGHLTEWIASMDTDEYLVPQGTHTSLRTVLEQATDTNILSFPSSRGKLRFHYAEAYNGDKSLRKMSNTTFLQAFNCDGSPTPRPSWADRARKQVYRSSYVLNHFVHYSTITKGLATNYADTGKHWTRYFQEEPPSERRVDELHEAMMIHTKSLDKSQTSIWDQKCRFDFPKKYIGCSIGFPWPDGDKPPLNYNPETGLEYNCYVNRRTDEYWIPRLEAALQQRTQRIQTSR